MASQKFDFKKQFPDLYRPSQKIVSIVEVPKMKFFMIDGEGDPNTSEEYKVAIECLYAVSYALKMKIVKKQTPSKDYVVPPLEGLWYMEDMSRWSMQNKDEWQWTMMIRIPDFVTQPQIEKAIDIAKTTKNPVALKKLYVEDYNEGLSVQLMHLGPYDTEAPNIEKMHIYAQEQGYERSGKHHEIYLSDPRKAKPDRMKTILRQPISSKK
jgi:hypothetical protein